MIFHSHISQFCRLQPFQHDSHSQQKHAYTGNQEAKKGAYGCMGALSSDKSERASLFCIPDRRSDQEIMAMRFRS